MEVSNSVPDSQTSNQSQPINETKGVIGAPANVIEDIGGLDLVKKKRGRLPRVLVKPPAVKIVKGEDEDVYFICFDGGTLVLCDRRGCPKAYHPACIIWLVLSKMRRFFNLKQNGLVDMLQDTKIVSENCLSDSVLYFQD